MKRYYLPVIFFALFFTSCAKDEESIVVPGGNSPFAGHYSFKFNTSYSGTTEMDIDSEGKLDFNIEMRKNSTVFTATIKGTIHRSGAVYASIYKDTLLFAPLSGQLSSGEGFGYYYAPDGSGAWTSEYLR